jgi:transcriptional regulator with XRE-family HTH domain
MIQLGKFIRTRRIQLGKTQEQLAEGIMAINNLSRVESGQSLPAQARLADLLDRLGMDVSELSIVFMNKKEAAIKVWTDEIDVLLAEGEIEEVSEKLSLLEGKIGKNTSNQLKQFILMAKAVICNEKDEGSAEAVALCGEAIRLTYPKFRPDHVGTYTLTANEFRTIQIYARILCYAGQPDKAVQIFYGLEESTRRFCLDRFVIGRRLTGMYVGMAHCLEHLCQADKKKWNKEIIAACNKGLAVARETGWSYYLGDLAVHLGIAHFRDDDIETAKSLLTDACAMLKLQNRHSRRNYLISFAKEHMGMDL